MLIDLHTHTYPRSDDSYLRPDVLIEESKRLGLDGICITEHDNTWDPADILALGRKHNFPVFPGCEVTTEVGHILIFGLTHYIFGMHQSSFVRKCVEEAGGAIVMAHPYRKRLYERDSHTLESYSRLVDTTARHDAFSRISAIETLNGRGSVAENRFSLDVARRLNAPGTGASDAHWPDEVGTCATEFLRPVKTLDDLVGELRAGRVRAVPLAKRADLAQLGFDLTPPVATPAGSKPHA